MSRRRRKRKQESGDQDRWMVTYSDMITLLLIFFIVLYSMSQVEQSKFNALVQSLKEAFEVQTLESAPTKTMGIDVPKHVKNPNPRDIPKTQQNHEEQLDKLFQKLQQYIKNHHLKAKMSLVDLPKGVEITFQDSILFDLGKARLKHQAFPILHDVGGLLATVDNPVSIAGFTDDLPIHTAKFPSNWELSTARAQSVRRYLQKKISINPSRMRVVGYGQYHPKVPNNSKKHRAENRRVTLIVLRQSDSTAGA
ncbi:MAG TPA: flagellar motor protein MotB [Bacillales bacterium]|nr:flagellar motor protein MotB [Bacillales bacterium]